MVTIERYAARMRPRSLQWRSSASTKSSTSDISHSSFRTIMHFPSYRISAKCLVYSWFCCGYCSSNKLTSLRRARRITPVEWIWRPRNIHRDRQRLGDCKAIQSRSWILRSQVHTRSGEYACYFSGHETPIDTASLAGNPISANVESARFRR